MLSRKTYSDVDLEEQDIADAIRSYIALQARSWQRQQKNRITGRVFHLIDEARDNGEVPDVQALIKKVWEDRSLPLPELG